MYLRKITAKNISILSQLFEEGNLKPWDNLKLEYNLTNKTYFQWLQLKHAVEHKRKIIIKRLCSLCFGVTMESCKKHFIKKRPRTYINYFALLT